jgi:AcrR family transcriptional regulator
VQNKPVDGQSKLKFEHRSNQLDRMMAGPRGEHNRDEFVALVTDAAETIAAAEGLRGLGLRRIAGAVGYAPNSIYNAIGDLDDIVMRVNARTVDRLRQHLEDSLDRASTAEQRIERLGEAYLGFVRAEPKLWSLLFEHTLPDGRDGPPWLAAALARATGLVDRELRPLVSDRIARNRAVAALWASLHGIASLSTSRKLGAVTQADPRELARLLIRSFLAGVRETSPSGTEQSRSDR